MLFDVLVAGYLRANGWRTLVSVVAVGLGVAIATLLDITASTTGLSLAAATAAAGGAANLEIAGSQRGFDERVLARVRAVAGVLVARPVVSAQVSVRGRTLSLLGVDLLQRLPGDAEFRAEVPGPYAAAGSAPGADALLAPGAIVVSLQLAHDIRVRRGSELEVATVAGMQTLRVAWVFPHPLVGFDSSVAFADVGTAQAIASKAGTLDRIDAVIDPAETRAILGGLARQLPPGVHAVVPRDPLDDVRRVLRSLDGNLALMTVLAFVAGAVLIFNAVGVSVGQRRPEIGTLRTLGAMRGALFGVFLLEGTLLGVAGALLGWVVSFLAGPFVVEYLARVSGSLPPPGGIVFDPFLAMRWGAASIACAAAAAIVPALGAARAQPALALRTRGSELGPRGARVLDAGALVALSIAATIAVVAVGTRRPSIAYAACAALAAGAACSLPWAVRSGARFVRYATRRISGEARLAAINVGAAPHRSAIAIASLGAAIATIVCVAVVLDACRSAVGVWANATARSDIVLRDTRGAGRAPFPATLVARIASSNGVAAVDRSSEASGVLAVAAVPGTNLAELRERIVRIVAPSPLEVRATGEVRRNLTTLLDGAFAITDSLCILSLLIGVAGAVSTLSAVVIERRSDLGVLRRLGLGRDALRRMLLAEGAFVVLLAAAYGCTIGAVLAAVLQGAGS